MPDQGLRRRAGRAAHQSPRPPPGTGSRRRRTWTINYLYLFTLTGPRACPYSRTVHSSLATTRQARRGAWADSRASGPDVCRYDQLHRAHRAPDAGRRVRGRPRSGSSTCDEVLVFGRFGRPEAEGAFATCHCLTLPETEPGYYFWKDRATGELTRRSEWFVTKTPEVRVGATRIKYLISFVLPRFCEQSLERSWKAELYGQRWTAVGRQARHDHPRALSHRSRGGRAPPVRARRRHPRHAHRTAPEFYEDVAAMTRRTSRRTRIRGLIDFLRWDFDGLQTDVWRRDRDHVQQFPVLPAALHGAVRDAVGGIARKA